MRTDPHNLGIMDLQSRDHVRIIGHSVVWLAVTRFKESATKDMCIKFV